MAERRSLFGRLATLIGTLAGLLGGAAVMYVSPLVESVIKPGRPLANFAVETDGLTATFHNRYAGEGWWDFGDGTPLEPAAPDQPSVTHSYVKPGTYSARLFVRNFVGDEHERTVSIEVAVTSPSGVTPAIVALDALPVSADRTAPVTVRVTAQTTGADRLVWEVGGDRGPEVVAESPGKQERFVTFATPGQHTIILTAINGSQATRKAVNVQVDPPRGDTLVARLRITDRGTRTERRDMSETLPITLPRGSRGSVAIDRRLMARTGFMIVEAKLGPADPAFANLKLSISADKRSVQVTGTLSPTSAMLQAQAPPTIPLILTQERLLKLQSPPTEVTAAVAVPGITALPLPALVGDGAQMQRAVVLELRGASGLVWQQPLPAKNSLVEYQGRRYSVSASPGDKEVRVELTANTVGLTSREKP